MGTIVDLTNLVTKLVESVQDRKFAAELREVQRMISSFQSEQATLHEQNIKLRTENSELKQSIASLKRSMAEPGERAHDDETPLDDMSEKLLQFISNATHSLDYYAAADSVGSRAKGQYHLDILRERGYTDSIMGSVFTSANGRKYLAKRNLL